MPKPIKKKTVKKKRDSEDEVKEKLTDLRDTFQQRQKDIIKYIAVALSIILVVGGYIIYSKRAGSKAAQLRHEAYTIYHGPDRTEQAIAGEKYQRALELFQKSYETRKSPITLLYIAACYDELEKDNEAIETLKNFVKQYPHEEKLLPLAHQKMASLYKKQGNLNEALETLNALLSQPGDIYNDLALMESGKILEQMGKPDEAQKKYQELANKYPNSPFVEEAVSKLPEKPQKKE